MSLAYPVSEARRFVQQHYGRRATPISPLAAGEWSQAYAFVLDGREAVVRFGAHGEDFAKDAVMGERGTADLPIPRILEYGRAGPRFFAVAERAHGTPLDALDGGGMRALLPSLLRVLDAARDVDVSTGSGYGLWDADQAAPHPSWAGALLHVASPRERLAGWREALETAPGEARAFDAACAALQHLVAGLPHQERRLIHGDLLYHNVLVLGGQITAVLDWGNALYGDHLYDAAWLLYWWPWYPAWAGIDIRAALLEHWDAAGARPADLDARLRCYLLHIGLDAVVYNAFTRRWDELRRNLRLVQTVL